ncbi:MAG: DUF885 domain-containing protein [Candidatus Sericytochromatia bacterium]
MSTTVSLEDKKLLEIIEKDWQDAMRNYPELATQMGDNDYNDRLSNLSEEFILEKRDNLKKTLAEIAEIPQEFLSEENKLNYALFKDKIEGEIREIDFKGYLMPVNLMMGVQEEFSRMVELMPYKKESDFQNYLSRLNAFPTYANQMIELMRKGLSMGVTVPKHAIVDVISQIRAQLPFDFKESVYYIPLKNAVKLSDSLRNEIEHTIQEKFYPAFHKIADFIEKEYVPNTRTKEGLSEIPNGKEYYNHKLKSMTTTNLTAEEVHNIGLQEVERIAKELVKVYEETGFKGSYDEFLDDLRNNPKLYFTKAKDLILHYRDISKRADKELPKLFKVLPRLPYGVEEIPAHQAPSYPTAYYLPPDLNMTRAGIFYANTSELSTRPIYESEALTLHEAVPGHHLQIALSYELTNLPKFRRGFDYIGYIEGWGLYSEKLGYDMGFYKDPYSKFGLLSFEMWRACRLVIDTGIHALGWSRDKSIDFLKEKTGKSYDACRVEVDRYISIPGQATSYKIGELKIMELKKKFMDKKGEDFDIREFHDVVLRNGPLPLNILEDYVDSYLKNA